jgi:hypothetical protein
MKGVLLSTQLVVAVADATAVAGSVAEVAVTHLLEEAGGGGALVVASTVAVATLAVAATTTPSTSALHAKCARRRVIMLIGAAIGLMKSTFLGEDCYDGH